MSRPVLRADVWRTIDTARACPMIRLATKQWLPRMVGVAIVALATFGIWVTTHATWVVAHGGDKAFNGTFDYPWWSGAHFVAALVFVTILPFQLSSRIRNAHRRVHRIAGRVAAICGVAFSLTGLMLPFVMPARPFGERAYMATVSVLLMSFLWRGIAAARRRDIETHRRWMLRVAAGALAPLSERIIFPAFSAAGIDSMPRFWDLFVTALWFASAINFIIVEWWIRWTANPELTPRRVPVSEPA